VRFGVRLILFFTVTLLVIQGATIWAIQTNLRASLMLDGQAQVAAAETRFVRQLSELEDKLAESVRLLTMDYALRRAIAEHDAATVVSALRNHGHRVGASRMLLIAPDGTIEGDTSEAAQVETRGEPRAVPGKFSDPALLDRAEDEERAGRVAIMDDKPVWLVAVPVMAPDLIAYVAAALPLDDAQLTRIRDIAGVPGQIGIVSFSDGAWRAKAGTIDAAVLRHLPENGAIQAMTGTGGDETIVVTRALETAPNTPAVRVVLDYPLSDVLRRYRSVSLVLIPVLLVGLIATLAGAIVISRGVARPIEALARQTRRIADGDYTPPPPLRRTDEVGQLSLALGNMTRAIAEREQRVHHQATHDPVTGLANRQAVAAAIDALVASGSGAILVVGLIRWRETTSTVGRDVGDRLLGQTAARIQACFATVPGVTIIGSVGESSFAVLLKDAARSAATSTAAKVIEAFDMPYREGQLKIDAPVAVGIALLPDHGTEAAQLLRRAEVALADAVSAETRSAVYRLETDPHRPERLSLMSDLRAGIARGEFRLVYQPKLDLKLGRITGAEALVRWNHPARGPVMPDDFIALAEETGNIQHITRWALRAGLTEVRHWRDQGLPARVAINLSVRDLADDTLPTRIEALLRELQVAPRSLVLEITESAIMGEPDAAIAVLRRLDEMGIDLAIDDFGVGQSSFAYMRRLPVREIKLDKAFILNLATSPDDQAIVRAITELGHGLGYHVTAEGVEDPNCLRLLREYGCDHAQGYFVSKPLEPGAFMGFVAASHGRWAPTAAEAVS
jgi:diguanylate cyclase (GGDEF)-like protein